MQRPVSLTRFSPVPLFMLQSLQSSPCLPPPLQVVGGKDGALRSTARPDKTHRRGQACWCGAAVGSLGLKGFTAFTDEAVRAVSSLAALTSSYGSPPNLRTRGVNCAQCADCPALTQRGTLTCTTRRFEQTACCVLSKYIHAELL
jgi:hypothetical protein